MVGVPLSSMRRPLLLLLSFCSALLTAQSGGTNPFELVDRIPEAERLGAVAGAEGVDSTQGEEATPVNPFDLRRGELAVAGPITASAPAQRRPSESLLVIRQSNPQEGRGSILLIHLGLLLAMASLWMLFRDLLGQCLAGTFNDGIMTQLYRRRSGGQIGALWLCYVFFFLASGFYLYLFARYHDISLGLGPVPSWLVYSLVVSSAVGLKHLVLFAYARLFPVRRDVSRYAFVLMVFSILAGLLLVPINLLISYAPEAWRGAFLYGGLGVLALVYLLHLLRGGFIAASYLATRPVHILLYICAIEIAPLLLVYRYLSDALA